MAAAYAYTRVLGTAASVCRSLPTLSGANGAHLVLKSDGEQVGPPAGARRFGARWRRGRIEGDADILVMPVADWGCEVHVTVRSPGSPAGFALARTKRLIVTVEEAYLAGGFGSAVLELLEENGLQDRVRVVRMGIPDRLVTHGDPKLLLAKYGLDADGIFTRIKESVEVLDDRRAKPQRAM